MDGIAESSILQKKLNMTSQRLIEKQMILDQKMKILEENEGQAAIREKDIQSRISTLIKMQKELDTKKEEFENEKLTNENKMQETFMSIKKEMDCNFTIKETTLLEHEKELQCKTCVMEEMTQKLNQREDDLKLLQVDLENDKMKLQKTMADFEQEKLQLKEVEGVIFEAHELNKNIENVWAKLATEQSKVGEII
jgi:hypothetical protein